MAYVRCLKQAVVAIRKKLRFRKFS